MQRRIARKVLTAVLTESTPPIVITTIGRSVQALGKGMVNAGHALQNVGAQLEAYGEAQQRRNEDMFTRTPTPPQEQPIPVAHGRPVCQDCGMVHSAVPIG